MGFSASLNILRLPYTGWGVVFAPGVEPAIRDALRPLLDHRKGQAASKDERRYLEAWGPDKEYRQNESNQEFLARHGVAPGRVDSTRLPYYLLLVGDPEAIPYRFQHQLDVQYAVGRIHFDQVEDYARYAESVVRAETAGNALRRRAAFLNPVHPNDKPTRLLAETLTRPLAERAAARLPDWEVTTVLGAEAIKEAFKKSLLGHAAPALVFTAGHGLGFPNGDPRQMTQQGSLLCQEWPGPLAWRDKRIPENFFLSAADVGDDADLLGRIAIHYSSFGAGTPRHEEMFRESSSKPLENAPISFVARLSQRLLAHPKGGMLAVLGLAGRSWGYSYAWPQSQAQLFRLLSSVLRVMSGMSIGLAAEDLDQRYAELSTELYDRARGHPIRQAQRRRQAVGPAGLQ